MAKNILWGNGGHEWANYGGHEWANYGGHEWAIYGGHAWASYGGHEWANCLPPSLQWEHSFEYRHLLHIRVCPTFICVSAVLCNNNLLKTTIF
jgi:hypothetical protein